METLAAIGLASNILNFVDTGFKLVQQCREISMSADGSTEAHARLEQQAHDLIRTIQALEDANHSAQPTGNLTTAERNVQNTAKTCLGHSKELVELLQDMKIDSSKRGGSAGVMKYLVSFDWRRKRKQVEQLGNQLVYLRQSLQNDFGTLLM